MKIKPEELKAKTRGVMMRNILNLSIMFFFLLCSLSSYAQEASLNKSIEDNVQSTTDEVFNQNYRILMFRNTSSDTVVLYNGLISGISPIYQVYLDTVNKVIINDCNPVIRKGQYRSPMDGNYLYQIIPPGKECFFLINIKMNIEEVYNYEAVDNISWAPKDFTPLFKISIKDISSYFYKIKLYYHVYNGKFYDPRFEPDIQLKSIETNGIKVSDFIGKE